MLIIITMMLDDAFKEAKTATQRDAVQRGQESLGNWSDKVWVQQNMPNEDAQKFSEIYRQALEEWELLMRRGEDDYQALQKVFQKINRGEYGKTR